jgi:hypothetical protein
LKPIPREEATEKQEIRANERRPPSHKKYENKNSQHLKHSHKIKK